MERVFSVEEIPNPYWAPPQSQAPAAGAAAAPVRGGGGAEGSGGVAAVDGVGAMNRSPSEWYFQKFLEEAALDSPGPGTSVGRGLGGVDAVEIKPPVGAPGAASSLAVDPVEYNAMLKQKLEKDLAAVAMWRVRALDFSS
jgi:hypothetical protein